MQILFVCHHLPYQTAPHSGGTDVYHYIDSLRQRHAVSLLSFVTPEEAPHVQELAAICQHVAAVPHSGTWLTRLSRLPLRLIYPMQHGYTRSPQYRAAFRQLCAQYKFDVLHIEAPWMAQYATEAPPRVAKVLDEVDIYAEVARQAYQTARGWLKPYLKFELAKLAPYELQVCRRMNAVVARSRHDVQWLRDRLPDVRVELLPPWFEGLRELAALPAERPPANDLLFVGAMHLAGNAEAVAAFARETLPLIRASIPDARLLIVGGNPRPEVVALHDDTSIIVTGYVEDFVEWYRRAAVVIAPLRRAGGILVKVLNGMAAARPVVASSAANRGVGGRPDVDVLIADQPAEESQHIVRLLHDVDYWIQLARSGRQFVQANYDWAHAMQSLEQLYSDVTGNS